MRIHGSPKSPTNSPLTLPCLFTPLCLSQLLVAAQRHCSLVGSSTASRYPQA